jgi:ABC-2 type transport system ATP-binding protein
MSQAIPPAQSLIEVNGVTKKYKSLLAVDNVRLSIAKGVCFGLLGPNGAGKTTLIEIIEDIILPTAGQILYNGAPRMASYQEEVGIMFQQTALLSFLTVEETLRTFNSLYRHPQDIEALIEQCHLGDIRKQMNDKISGGQRQRLLLALALVNRPKLLFLDEPSTGLDPQARRNLWEIIEKVKKEGKTIVLTTHYMEEAQHLCDEIAIMDHGRIIAKGSPNALIARHCKGMTISIPVNHNEPPWLNPALEMAREDDRIEIRTDNLTTSIQQLLESRVDLSQMTVRLPNLEDVFLTLTGRRLRD